VTTTCSVSKGDLPLKIWWTFKPSDQNEFPYNLTAGDGLMITKPSPKMSLLVFESIKPRHRGSYSCFVSNAAGNVFYNANLSINGLKKFSNDLNSHGN
jgi:hypothetical protein